MLRRLSLPFALTHLDRVLSAEPSITKGALVAYYAAVSNACLPHVGGRPLTLVRCPSGIGKKCFFQKHATVAVPHAVQRVQIAETGTSVSAEYMTVSDLPGWLALAQLGTLEVHTWCCHIDNLERPDQLIFDLDPGEGLGWPAVVEGACFVKQRLAALGLESFVKTTGGKGLHVVVPLARRLDWSDHYAFARAFAESVAHARPTKYLTNMRKAQRKGKIFIDYLRNARGATAVAPYSMRARPGALVATPITWQELEDGVKPAEFDIHTVAKRLAARTDDPWSAYGGTTQRVTAQARKAVGVR